jgi:hypothetical protein
MSAPVVARLHNVRWVLAGDGAQRPILRAVDALTRNRHGFPLTQIGL